MPRTVTATFSDGTSAVYNNVPDDVTPDAFLSRIGKDHSGKSVASLDGGKGASQESAAAEPSSVPSGGIPGNMPTAQRQAELDQYAAQDKALADRSFLNKAVGMGKGVIESGLTIGSALLHTPEAFYHAAKGVPDSKNPALAKVHQPRGEEGQQYMKAVGKAFEKLPPNIPIIGAEAAMLNNAGRVSGGLRASEVAAAKAKTTLAPDVAALKAGASKLAEVPLSPRVSPEKAALLQKAADMGITPSPHVLSKHKYVRLIGDLADNMPMSGSPLQKNRESFNTVLAKEMGAAPNEGRLTSLNAVPAMEKSGAAIGEVFATTNIPARTLFENTSKFRRNLGKQTEETTKIAGSYMDELSNMAKEGKGTVGGENLRTWNSELGKRIRELPPGDLRSTLSDLQEGVMDAVKSSLPSDEARAAFQQSRKQYAVGKLLEPLIAKGDLEGLDPTALRGRLTSTPMGKHRMATDAAGTLGDLAKVATNFMTEPRSSMTTERSVIANMALDTGKLIGGVAAYLPAAAYNKFGPLITKHITKKSLAEAKAVPKTPGRELAMVDNDSPFPVRAATEPAPVTDRGLLSLEEQTATPAASPRAVPAGNEIDFPLRQEILQQPAVREAIEGFRIEAAKLEKKAANAISPNVRANAKADLAKLQVQFAAGMKELGIDDAAGAHGLNRKLYETGSGKTSLPVQKGYDARK